MKYPIGIQDFRKLREGGYVYVDKTRHIHGLLGQGNYLFLARPRRFGKSLLLATLNELYQGRRELFAGLWIEDQWDWEANRRPVIWLKFSSQGLRTLGLEGALHNMLDDLASQLGVDLRKPDQPYDQKFKELITKLGQAQKVVLLIDEYDKPIIDYLDDLAQAEAHRGILKSFYSVLKDCDPYLELVFITGVSAFSKVSIFSDLNNLENISLSPAAFTLVGITQQELEAYFPEQLGEVNAAKVKRWYNGYSWGGPERVYNPFSLLRFLKDRQFHNFWFETGTPTFLLQALRQQRYFDLEEHPATELTLNEFDIAHLHPITVLFQTGYLTILRGPDRTGVYTLGFPNQEVKSAFQERLLNIYAADERKEAGVRIGRLVQALESRDLETVITILNATFATLPYEHWSQANEHFFHALIHLTFSLLGVYVQSEVHTARGRCDALVQTERYLYAFEFKLDRSAAEALQQIAAQGYLHPYADAAQEKIAVGINFSSQTRQVTEWAVGKG